MVGINSFKRWFLNTMVPYIESANTEVSKSSEDDFTSNRYAYSDLNEDTEYS